MSGCAAADQKDVYAGLVDLFRTVRFYTQAESQANMYEFDNLTNLFLVEEKRYMKLMTGAFNKKTSLTQI